MKHNQRGVIVPVLILLVLGLSATGMYVYSKNNTTSKTPTDISLEPQTNSATAVRDVEKTNSNSGQDTNSIEKSNAYIDTKTQADEYTEGLGYRFRTPWGKGQVSTTTQHSPDMKQFVFENGKKILLSCTSDTPRDELNELVAEDEYAQNDIDKIASYLGSKIDSGYEFTQFLLSINENSVKNSSDPSEKEILSNLLFIKSILMSQSYTINQFEKEYVKGFQLGNYQNTQITRIDMYTNDNKKCVLMANNEHSITQDDIDLITSTFSKK